MWEAMWPVTSHGEETAGNQQADLVEPEQKRRRALFLDPAPGLHDKCKCDSKCEMPCWQLYGLTDQPCGACGCPPFEEQQRG